MFVYGIKSGDFEGKASADNHRNAALSAIGKTGFPLGKLTMVSELLYGEQHYFCTDDLLEELSGSPR
jgi:hypothetical protein